jgi:hypothetical protein
MKVAIIFLLLFSFSHFLKCSENKIVDKLTKVTKDLISGIFLEVKGQSWILPPTCLDEQFENDISGFLMHLKKFQTVYSSAYLNKITVQDVFSDCPADEIINLYLEIKKSIKSGQFYLNCLLNSKKIISLVVETIKARKLDPLDIGLFFGKLINLSVYDKSENNFFLITHSDENKKVDEQFKNYVSSLIENILQIVTAKKVNKKVSSLDNYLLLNDEKLEIIKKFQDNKGNHYRWGLILEKLLEKYEKNIESTIFKKFLIYSLTSLDIASDLIKDFQIENINQGKILTVLDLLSNMLE